MKDLSELEQLLAKLISFKSITSNKEESTRLLDWVESQLGEHLFVERLSYNGYSSLIATTRKTKTPKVFLAAHIDVVPGSDSLFTMRVVENTFMGRGAMDMKFAAACYLQLVKELGAAIQKHDIGIMLVSDEESGGFNGSKILAQEGYGAETILLPDGGYDWNVDAQSKGIVWLQAKAHGRSAHGSRPWEGSDPFEPLFLFLQDLKKQFAQEPCGDPKHKHHTMTVGKLSGGAVANQMAPSAEALIDIRFLPSVDKLEIERMVAEVAKRHEKIDVQVIESEPAFNANLNTSAIKRWRAIVEEKYGITAEERLSHGSSDARFFDTSRFSVLLTAPRCGDFHTEEEWIDRVDLQRFYEVMKQWVIEVA